jgi:hypothetical protein
VALGENDGQVDLVYPERETWLGSTNAAIAERLPSISPLRRCRVPIKQLDAYLGELSGKRLLIKIDTEGSELPIIHGAKQTLLASECAVIFEAWSKNARRPLFEVFGDLGYSIRPVRRPDHRGINLSEFIGASAGNFLALPDDRWRSTCHDSRGRKLKTSEQV